MARARGELARGGGVLLTGPEGIGKSVVLGVLAAECGSAGDLVLRCGLSEAEQGLPLLGLIDLFAEVGEDVFRRLPERERCVLDAALLRDDGADGSQDVLALRLAVLALFRELAERTPVLLVVDDAQWLDERSADLLRFVARRTRGFRHALRTVAARRTEPGREVRPSIPLLPLRVPPMDLEETGVLLAGTLGVRWGAPLVRRVHTASGGNPYFALELARAVADRGEPRADEPLPLPGTLRGLMSRRLDGCSPAVRRMLLTASAAARPTVGLVGTDAVADAAADGLIEVDGDAVRFAHPLMAAVVYEEASATERFAVHAALAAAVTDPVERARHLALVSTGPDEGIAATLSAAATAARRRGAPATASRLGELAAEHTPRGAAGERDDRLLTAAEDAVAAGAFGLARRIAHEVLAGSVAPPVRVRAWNVIVDSSGQALADVDVFDQAISDARGDPALLAQLRYRMSWRAWMVDGDPAQAREQARLAARLAALAGDRRTELFALVKQASTELYLGHPDVAETVAAALAEPQDPRVRFDHNGPVYLKHRCLLVADRLEEARNELRTMIYVVRQRGAAESLCAALYSLSQVETARGRCERALDLAAQSLRVAEDTGMSQGPPWYATALAEAAGGSLERALTAAENAQARTDDDADMIFLPRTLHAEGLIRLLRGESVQAVQALRRLRTLESEQGLGDPAMRRWHADLADSLTSVGRTAEALAFLDQTRTRAAALGRQSVLACVDRSTALALLSCAPFARAETVPQVPVHADAGARALRLLEGAAETLRTLGYAVEQGRTLLALGRARRLLGDEAGGWAALREARRVFTRSGAKPWLALVDAEPEEHGTVAAPGPDVLAGLTETERRVAVLVAAGATNREIATRLFVSVKTVEAALTRIFRKLGVRSRVDVARLAARDGKGYP